MLQHIALTILALSAPVLQQEQGTSKRADGPPVFSVSELEIQHYKPVHVPAYDLEEIARGMVGRAFYLDERGGHQSAPIDNLTLVGESLLLYDTPEYLKRMVETLRAIDQPGEEGEQAQEDPPVTFHYTPRYLSMEDVFEVVEPLTNHHSIVKERRILVVHDKASVVRKIETLLKKVDLPEEQVLLTAYLVRGFKTGEVGPALPGDLTEHLGRLVPGLEFEAAGFAMLQSSVVLRSGTQLSLKLSGSAGEEEFNVSFAPVAYDDQTGSLSVERCQLIQAFGNQHEVIFSTDTIFRGGEYTVLGATGAKPIFVVIRLTAA